MAKIKASNKEITATIPNIGKLLGIEPEFSNAIKMAWESIPDEEKKRIKESLRKQMLEGHEETLKEDVLNQKIVKITTNKDTLDFYIYLENGRLLQAQLIGIWSK